MSVFPVRSSTPGGGSPRESPISATRPSVTVTVTPSRACVPRPSSKRAFQRTIEPGSTGSRLVDRVGLDRQLEEIRDHAAPVRMIGVETLRVELRAPPVPLRGRDRLDRTAVCSCENAEVRRQLRDLIGVILEDGGPGREPGEQAAVL